MPKILDRLERDYGRYAVENVTLYLVVMQVFAYIISKPQPQLLNGMLLVPSLVLQGQVWRLLTFLAVPPLTNPIFAFFFWYLFYLMGTALESYWGVFRYNMYLLIGYAATVLVSFLVPDLPSSNAFLQGSVFLAFAFLNPDFQLLLFFILPVKIKWLALITWIGYFFVIVLGSWLSKLLVLASISNYLFFFGEDIKHRIKAGRRQMEFQAQRFAAQRKEDEPYHRCVVCGITDLTHPDMDFRYCTSCYGTPAYCQDHLRAHEHRTEPAAPPSTG